METPTATGAQGQSAGIQPSHCQEDGPYDGIELPVEPERQRGTLFDVQANYHRSRIAELKPETQAWPDRIQDCLAGPRTFPLGRGGLSYPGRFSPLAGEVLEDAQEGDHDRDGDDKGEGEEGEKPPVVEPQVHEVANDQDELAGGEEE